ncbi:hypothetical protein F5888DRAFT_1704913 [Russula emetica]|nr:hypothetical protein F5888DRAFT_1704913 [Russula emetica]
MYLMQAACHLADEGSHPNKFETRILHRVVEEEREGVKTGAGVVVRGLNEMLNKDYED